MPYKYKELTSIVFSTIHSEGTVAVLVINTLLHDIAFSVILSAFSQSVYPIVCPKLNGYRDNGQRKVWSSGGSTHCTCQLTSLIDVCP